MPFLNRVFRSLFWLVAPASLLFLAACSSSEDRAKSYYESGLEYVEQGDLVKANLEFRNALKLDANYVDALFALGKVEEQRQNFAAAVKLFISVAEHEADHVEARLHLSYILLAAGQVDLAQKYADEAYALDKTDSDVLVAQSAVKLKLGDTAAAIDLANQALASDPESVDALMVLASERLASADAEAALTILDKAPASSNRNVGLQMQRLAALDSLDDQAGVEKLFGELIDLFPENNAFRSALVNWYLSKNRIDDAERTLREYGKTDPTNVDLQLAVVSFLNTRRGPDAAREELERLIAENEGEDGLTFRYQMSLAQLQFTTGDKDSGIALVQSLADTARDTKDQNEARITLARMLVDRNEPNQALSLASKVVEADPGNADALSVRASIRMLQGDAEGAIQDLLTALNEAPDNSALHSLLAEAYESSGSVTLAEQEFGKALTLAEFSPTTALPYAQFLIRYGKSDQALRTLENVVARAPADRRVLTLLAQLKLEARDWTGAQEIADQLNKLENGSADPTADQIKAAALSGLDKNSESIDLLKSLATDANNKQAVLPDLIRTYVRAGRFDDAIAHLETLLNEDPNDIQARVLLGSVHSTMGDMDLAEQSFKQAAADDQGVTGDVSLAQFYLGANQLDATRSAVNAGLAKQPDSSALLFILAAVHERSREFDEAISVYEKLFEQNPGSTIAANDLASLLSERRGDKASLDRAFEIAQRFSSSNVPQYLDTLGWIHYLREDYASALPLLKTAANELPNAASAQYHLGMVLMKLGQADAAKQSLEKALELSPPLIPTDVDKVNVALEQIADGATAADVQN